MESCQQPYDAILLVSFGGPEGMEDVIPFLENVLRGRNVPRERMLEVAHHYEQFDGISPINEQCRDLIEAMKQELTAHNIDLPIYWGNRNWHPMLPDTVEQMKKDGVKRALAFFTSIFSSYSGCRQYRENVIAAREQVGEDAPVIEKVRMGYNHPEFIAASADCVNKAITELPADAQSTAQIAFTAHSIPDSMANQSDYEKQLQEACRLVAEECGVEAERWQLVYQSRSGRPQDPWLEPDILDHLQELKNQQATGVVIMPIGFISDHMEVLFDLDTEAKELCDELELPMARAATVGVNPRFLTMIRELIEERMGLRETKRACGQYPANHDVCPVDCCLPPKRPGRPAVS